MKKAMKKPTTHSLTKFTENQKIVYNAVLRASKVVFDAIRPQVRDNGRREDLKVDEIRASGYCWVLYCRLSTGRGLAALKSSRTEICGADELESTGLSTTRDHI